MVLRHKKGQSLVEVAIFAPLLIFILMGVFEVGYAIRNYMIILNASREGARFAARPQYLDAGYEVIFNHTKSSIAEQLDFENKGDIVVSILESDSNLPCNPNTLDDMNGNRKFSPDPQIPGVQTDWWPDCDCSLVATNPYTPYQSLITTTTYISESTRLDLQDLMLNLSEENNVHNCLAMKKTTLIIPTINRSVAVEVFYEHNQLFGFPFISNPFTDPITLHAYTIMRITDIRNRNW